MTPPINIDGESENYSNVTIDGQTVKQITIDGQEVLSTIPDSGVAYWPMSSTDNGTSEFKDIWSNNTATNDGSVYNSTGGPGNTDGYYDFNGNNHAYANVDFTLNRFTVVAYARIINSSSNILGTFDTANNNGGFSFFVDNGTVTYDHPGDSGGAGFAGGGNVDTGEWYMLTFMKSGDNEFKIYVNDSNTSTDTKSWGVSEDTISWAGRYEFGSNDDNAVDEIDIAEVRYYNKGLTDTEVSNLFNTGSIDG